mgnify:FL=1
MYRSSKATARAGRLAWILGLLVLPAAMAHADSSTRGGEGDVGEMIAELGLREGSVAVRDMPGWTGLRKVVIRLDGPDRLPALQAAAPNVEIVAVDSVEAAAAEIADGQGLIGL